VILEYFGLHSQDLAAGIVCDAKNLVNSGAFSPWCNCGTMDK
jgi:hypothetical protein